MSGVKVGCTAAGSAKLAVLPAGTLVKLHANVSGSPSMSVDPDPSSCTGSPVIVLWFRPAYATGEVLPRLVLTTTTSGALSDVPSLTMSSTT